MLKIIAGLVAGFAVALASIYVIWLVGLQIYPLPPATGSTGLERWGELIPTLPTEPCGHKTTFRTARPDARRNELKSG
jgi:hypothetical protein